MNSPDDLDSALTDALHRRADGISVPNDGRARFDQMLAQDTRNRHRRRVGMSLVGIVAVVAIGATAVGFATTSRLRARSPRPSPRPLRTT